MIVIFNYELLEKDLNTELARKLLDFIQTATPEQLNAQDLEGYTPLNETVEAWENAKEKPEMQNIHEIIILALLRYGADPNIGENEEYKAVNSTFFREKNDICQQAQTTFEFNRLLKAGIQEDIIGFLRQNIFFVRNNIIISYEAYKSDLLLGVEELNKNNDIPFAEIIDYALEKNDIETIKKIIRFDSFVEDNKTLNKTRLIARLAELGDIHESIIDKIIAHDKINYQDSDGNRYLQRFIREQNWELALKFIESAPQAELDAIDKDQITALTVANIAWYNIRDLKEYKYRKKNCEETIKALIKNGADVSIVSEQFRIPKHLDFFVIHRKRVKKLQSRYQQGKGDISKIQTPEKIEKLSSKSYCNAKTIVTAVSIVGLCAVIYFCNNYFNQNNINEIGLK